MSFCNWLRRQTNPPAAAGGQPTWLTGPFDSYMDVYILAPSQEAEFEAAYNADGKGIAWAWVNTNETIFKEHMWPRHARPVGIGWLATKEMPPLFSNAHQEGVYIHEVLGHAIMGLNHEDPHVTMHNPENLPATQRLNLMLEITKKYSFLRIQYWMPGISIHDDDPIA